jgi:hypothetical protein
MSLPELNARSLRSSTASVPTFSCPAAAHVPSSSMDFSKLGEVVNDRFGKSIQLDGAAIAIDESGLSEVEQSYSCDSETGCAVSDSLSECTGSDFDTAVDGGMKSDLYSEDLLHDIVIHEDIGIQSNSNLHALVISQQNLLLRDTSHNVYNSYSHHNRLPSNATVYEQPISERRYVRFSAYGRQHYNPQDGVEYFKVKNTAVRQKTYLKTLAVFIPAFNEDVNDLILTLNSLYRQKDDCKRMGYDIHAVVVLDGWEFTSSSVKDYLSNTFVGYGNDTAYGVIDEIQRNPTGDLSHVKLIHDADSSSWRTCIRPLDSRKPPAEQSETYVLQCIDGNSNDVSEVRIGTVGSEGELAAIKISVIIKRDNRRKHNSHSFFLKAFCSVYEPELMFMTDTGSIIADSCLHKLLSFMKDNERCSACTARMRIHPLSNKECNTLSFRQKFYHYVQRYEYEFTQNVVTPSFSFVGQLLVIPGMFATI